MPSVNIREIDTTGSDVVTYQDYTVLVPGPVLSYTEGEESKKLEGLITSTSEFVHNYDAQSTVAQKDLGFVTAYQLVKRGFPVYYFPAYNYSEDAITGLPVRDYATYLDPFTGKGNVQYTADNLFDDFTDKGKYDIRFITIGGLFEEETEVVAVSQSAIACAAKRGDAVALVDVPEAGYLDEPAESGESGEQEKRALFNSILIDK